MDYLIFNWLFGFSMRWPLVGEIGRFFAVVAIWLLLLAVFYLWLGTSHARQTRQSWFVRVVGSSALVYALNALIGLFYFRPRPFVTHQIRPLIDYLATHKSFPSDHAAVAFSLAVGVMFVSRRWGVVALITAALISLGRVSVGVHYPADVLAGAVLGVGVAWLTHGFVARRAKFLTGRVVKGTGQGRQLGLPTANFIARKLHALPTGHYAVWSVDEHGRLPGMAIVVQEDNGVSLKKQLKVRVHLIGFDGELGGRVLRLLVVDKINDFVTLDNLTALGKIWQQDCLAAKQRLQEDLRRNLF